MAAAAAASSTRATRASYLRHPDAPNHWWMAIAAALFAFGGSLGVMIAYGEADAFFVTLALIVCLGIVFDFRVGAVALMLMMPLGATHFMPHSVLNVPGLNPLNILVVATLFAAVARGQLKGMPMKPLFWLLALPIVFAGLNGMPHVENIASFFFEAANSTFDTAPGYFREMAVRPLMIPLTAVLIGAALARSQKPERFLVPLIIAVLMLGLFMIGYILASGVRLGFLASAQARSFFNEMGLHANDLGRMFAVAYALLLFVWWETKSLGMKTALFFTLAVAALAVVLSFSRGGMLGFFVVNALFLAWKRNLRTVGLALLGAVFVALLAPHYLWNRITFGFASGDVNTVSADRIDGIWIPLLPEIWSSPIWGHGLASIMWSKPMLLGTMLQVSHPHSAYLEAILDMGFVGLGLMLAYYYHVWKNFRALGSNAYISPEMRGLFQGGSAALVCFMITGWAGSSLRPDTEFSFLWLAIGLMYGMLARKPAG